jgi:hypothetical protein
MHVPGFEIDNCARNIELGFSMRHSANKVKKKLAYPDETEGSRIASEVRKQASKLTAEQRRELFKRAMVRIYGGQPKGSTVAGH